MATRSGGSAFPRSENCRRARGSAAGQGTPSPVVHRLCHVAESSRGHGAPTPEICGKLSSDVEQSIKLIIDHLPVLQRPWAYLHRNLSGKFQVIPLGGDISSFDSLKTTEGADAPRYRNMSDGVYVDFQEYAKVDLIDTSIDVSDFFFPNGGFKGTTFELLSLISDNRKQGDASPYLAPAGERPPSETEGRGVLEDIGETLDEPSTPGCRLRSSTSVRERTVSNA